MNSDTTKVSASGSRPRAEGEAHRLAIEPIDTSFSFKNKAYAALKNVIVSMDIYRSRTDIRLDERQLAVGVFAHLLFEPVSDLGGMKLPVAADPPAGNAAALHQFFNFPPIAAQLLREFVESVPLV